VNPPSSPLGPVHQPRCFGGIRPMKTLPKVFPDWYCVSDTSHHNVLCNLHPNDKLSPFGEGKTFFQSAFLFLKLPLLSCSVQTKGSNQLGLCPASKSKVNIHFLQHKIGPQGTLNGHRSRILPRRTSQRRVISNKMRSVEQ
jgi:hypothetical protein